MEIFYRAAEKVPYFSGELKSGTPFSADSPSSSTKSGIRLLIGIKYHLMAHFCHLAYGFVDGAILGCQVHRPLELLLVHLTGNGDFEVYPFQCGWNLLALFTGDDDLNGWDCLFSLPEDVVQCRVEAGA